MTELRAWIGDADVMVRAEPESDGRVIDRRLLPWDTVAQTDEGRELFRRGAFADADPEMVTVEKGEHGGALVGRGLALEEREDAAYLSARISHIPAGDELLELVRDGVLRQVSIAFAPVAGGHRKRPDGVTERSRVELRRVAILERGAYPGAGVLAVRREPDMTDAIEQTTEAPAAPVVDLTPVYDRMERMESRMGALVSMGPDPGPLQYRAQSLGELLFKAVVEDHTLNRALVDQITTDNPGIVPPGVVGQVRNIINLGRRSIEAFGGGRPLPDTGMSVTWPRLTTPADLTTIYAVQATEKAEVISAKVSFGSGSSDVATYAGGSDVSYQLIRRSEPPYLELYAQTMLAAWAKVTNLAFLTAVTTAATGSEIWIPATDDDASAFVAALVAASVEVEAATGSPATFALLGTAAFSKVAGILARSSVNPQSVAGTVTAGGLRMNVSGIDVIHEPALGAATGLVSNEIAAGWLEDPVGAPAMIAVDDANKIGQNRAYWNMGAPAVFVPGGVVEFAAATREAAARRAAA